MSETVHTPCFDHRGFFFFLVRMHKQNQQTQNKTKQRTTTQEVLPMVLLSHRYTPIIWSHLTQWGPPGGLKCFAIGLSNNCKNSINYERVYGGFDTYNSETFPFIWTRTIRLEPPGQLKCHRNIVSHDSFFFVRSTFGDSLRLTFRTSPYGTKIPALGSASAIDKKLSIPRIDDIDLVGSFMTWANGTSNWKG